MDTVLALAAALVALRLAGELTRRQRTRRPVENAIWAGSLAAFGLAAAALAWGSSAGWDERAFRVYYLFGGLLTAPLLGLGSLARAGRRSAAGVALLYTGLAVGIALAMPVTGDFGSGTIPDAQDHVAFLPARLTAIAGNSLGTLAAVAVAIASLRTRRLASLAILAGVAVAAAGSGLTGLGIGESAVFLAVAVLLLYAGFALSSHPRESSQSPPTV